MNQKVVGGWQEGFDGIEDLLLTREQSLDRLRSQLARAQEEVDTFSPYEALNSRSELGLSEVHPRPIVVTRHDGEADRIVEDIARAVRSIEERLAVRYRKDLAEINALAAQKLGGHNWAIGTRRELIGTQEILRGHLILGQDRPIVQSVQPITVLRFVTIRVEGLKDHLERDGGQWGYHYHYCIKGKGRSDTMLCFGDFGEGQKKARLFHEKHNDGKAKGYARPDGWGKNKRISIYDACSPDLDPWPIEAFKRPSRGARLVWPLR